MLEEAAANIDECAFVLLAVDSNREEVEIAIVVCIEEGRLIGQMVGAQRTGCECGAIEVDHELWR